MRTTISFSAGSVTDDVLNAAAFDVISPYIAFGGCVLVTVVAYTRTSEPALNTTDVSFFLLFEILLTLVDTMKNTNFSE